MSKYMNRPPPAMPGQQQSQSTFVEKIMVGLDHHAPPLFDLRLQLIGAGGANLHYIRNETGGLVTLRGRGSMFIDPTLGTESAEPMHLYIEHPRYDGLQSAKQLAKNLIETLQQELVHYQQMNPPVPSVQYATTTQPTSTTTVLQQHQVIGQQPIPQMSVPPPMLAVPPPIIQQNNLDVAAAIQQQQANQHQQNFITQNTQQIIQTQPQPGQQQQIIQQQQTTMLPQSVPIQLHPGNMVIQQQHVQHTPTIGNVSIPPPGIHIPVKQGPLVHFQGPPPPMHLSHPPPNIQLQQPQATQIVLQNQPHQNYQYQYIQQTPIQSNDVTTAAHNQVTIQHIYQPQQQLQGIVQQTTTQTAAPQFNQFTQQTIRPQQIQTGQQYIVQGTAAYMMPPPNIIHQQQQQAIQQQQQQNIIFQTQPHPTQIQQQQQQQQIPLQHIQTIQQQPTQQSNDGGGTSDESLVTTIKEEIKSIDEKDSTVVKTEIKTESDDGTASTATDVPNGSNRSCHLQQQHQPMLVPTSMPAQMPPPAVMAAVPPPISCVQHIVGNTLITTSQPTQTQTHQIYNQIPVSIQQIPGQQQQIHVSTHNGQHFLVNAQQWPTQQHQQFQQVTAATPNGNIQSFQLATTAPNTTQLRHPNEIMLSNGAPAEFRSQQAQQIHHQQQPHQHILTTTAFNPQQIQTPVTGMQVQFQSIPTGNHQHIIQQQQLATNNHQHIIEQQQQQQQQQQHHHITTINNMPPPPPNTFSLQTSMGGQQQQQQHQAPPTSSDGGRDGGRQQIKMNNTTPPIGSSYQSVGGNSPQPVPYPQQQLKHNMNDAQHSRIGQKRKLEDDDTSGSSQPQIQTPRVGMGSNSGGGSYLNNQRDGHSSQNINDGLTSTNSSSSSQAATTSTTTNSTTNNTQDESCNSNDNVFTTTATNQSSGNGNNHNKSASSTTHNDQSSTTQSSSSGSYSNENNNRSSNNNYQNDCNDNNSNSNSNYNNNGNNNSMHGLNRMPPDGPPPPQQQRGGPRYRSNNHRDFSYLMRPPHMQDGNFPMHRMNFGPPPPPPPSYRGADGNSYGPPPPHFRNQW